MFIILRRIQRYVIINVKSTRYSCLVVEKLTFSRHNLTKA